MGLSGILREQWETTRIVVDSFGNGVQIKGYLVPFIIEFDSFVYLVIINGTQQKTPSNILTVSLC